MDAATLSFLVHTNQVDVRTASTAATTTNTGSSWTSGNSWGAGSIPTLLGRIPDNTTTGSLPFPSTTPNSSTWKLCRYKFVMQNGCGNAVLMDRLVDYGGGSGLLTTPQVFTANALTRYNSGTGNQIYLEVYTTGASSNACTATVSYTNEAGSTGRTATIALAAGWMTTTRIFMVPLQAGDKGVRAIASITLSAVSPNAGNFGCVIAHPLGMLTTGTVNTTGGCGDGRFRDFTSFSCQPILTNASLFLTYMSSSTAIGVCDISYSLV